jgi:hypothetical protein
MSKLPKFLTNYLEDGDSAGTERAAQLTNVSRPLERNFKNLINWQWFKIINPFFLYGAAARIYDRELCKHINDNIATLSPNFIYLEDEKCVILDPITARLGGRDISISASPIMMGRPVDRRLQDGSLKLEMVKGHLAVGPITYFRLRRHVKQMLKDTKQIRTQMAMYRLTF